MSGSNRQNGSNSNKINSNDTSSKRLPNAKKNQPIRVVVKRRKRAKVKSTSFDRRRIKPGIPNFIKELTEAPKEDEDDQNDNDDFFPPMEDAIPCDTLLAFQSLTSSTQNPHHCLTIPLQTSLHPIPCILESQLAPALQQHSGDHDSFAMVHQELADLFHKNTLRRLSSTTTTGSNNLSVLVATEEYRRGVWDAHDAARSAGDNNNNNEQQRSIVEWFVSHLHCWTGRMITESQWQATWNRDPPTTSNLPYYDPKSTLLSSRSSSNGLEYLQQIQVLLANHHQHKSETTFQLWLPQWGEVLSAFQSAHKKFLQRIQQTYQKEVAEKSFLQHPYYKGISSTLLLQWLQDQGIVTLVPKPYGNFITLVDKKKKAGGR